MLRVEVFARDLAFLNGGAFDEWTVFGDAASGVDRHLI